MDRTHNCSSVRYHNTQSERTFIKLQKYWQNWIVMQMYDNVLPIWQTQPPLSPFKKISFVVIGERWRLQALFQVEALEALQAPLERRAGLLQGQFGLFSSQPWTAGTFSLTGWKTSKGAQRISVSHKQVPSAAHSGVTSKYGMENIPTVPPSASLTFLHVLVRREAGRRRPPEVHVHTWERAMQPVINVSSSFLWHLWRSAALF